MSSILFFALIAFNVYADPKPILEMYRTKQGIGEYFFISLSGNKETVQMTSNYFKKEELEAGIYERTRSKDLNTKLLAIVRSEPALKNIRTIAALHDWNIKINGKKISHTNPRYNEVFSLAEHMMRDPSWSKVNVTRFVLHPEFKIIKIKNNDSRLINKPDHAVNLFKACNKLVRNTLICEHEGAFVYTNISGQKR